MKLKSKVMLLVCLSLIASCGKKTPEIHKEETLFKTYFVKGDPNTVVEGSTANTTSFIDEDKIEQFNNFSLSSIYQFTQQDEVVEKKDVGNIESGNEAQEEDSTTQSEKYNFNFVKHGNEYTYESSSKIDFSFSVKNGKLNISSLQTDGGSFDLKAIHYSLKAGGNAFSILAETFDLVNGRVIIDLTFIKKNFQRNIAKTSTNYKYLYGAGVKVPWNKKDVLEVNICSNNLDSKLEGRYKSGIALWNDALKNRLTVTTKTLYNYPPFNDLNNHCIYTVKNYLTIDSTRKSNPAATYTTADTYMGNLIDSDIMVWVKENEKTGQAIEEQTSMERIIGHEMGHLLGLDHQFTDGIYSIMSYDGIYWVTQYDTEAIAELYPLI